MVIDGVVLLWFGLTALSAIFVAVDIRNTPENPVMKWAFVLFTLYAGPFGAFLYVLGCREPLPGLHEQYVSARWRQVLGSTMHCVAGDGIGIIVGAVIGTLIALPVFAEVGLEYVLGFAFGWTIFQALFMRGMARSYGEALRNTFLSELLSMNCLMGGMIPVMVLAFAGNPAAHDPTRPLFWFHMSLSLMVGFVIAYPMNWWLVANHLKHGMMTVRHPDTSAGPATGMAMAGMSGAGGDAPMPASASHRPRPPLPVMAAVSFLVLAAGLLIAYLFADLTQPRSHAASDHAAYYEKDPHLILVTGHLRIAADAVDALRPHMRALVEATRQEDGCILYAFAEDVVEPGTIRIVERWRDWPALEAHGKAPHIAAWRDALGGTKVESVEVLAHAAGEERVL